jgi:uncharacterized protein involved in exopolysaccharide biosynthesis
MDNNNKAIPDKIDYLELFSLLWQRRKFILFSTVGITVVVIVISFLMTPTYLSETTILPDTESNKLGGLAELASLAGVNIPGEMVMVKLYPDIMKSETVLQDVIEKKYNSKLFSNQVNLYEFFDIDEDTPLRTTEVALELLRKKIKIDLNLKTGLITSSIETKDAQTSADILNALTQSLNKFLLTKRTTNAGEQRRWVEQRLTEVKNDLEKAENNLKDYREKNRRVSDSPQLLLEQERFVRDVQIQSTIFTTLKQQYEIAKIEEIKNVPIINILDEAKPAALKNGPKKRYWAVGGFLLGFIGSVFYVVFDLRYRRKIKSFLSVVQNKTVR